MQMFWPILVVLTANTFYNICAKKTPDNVDQWFALCVTYGIAMLLSLVMFLVSTDERSLAVQFSRINWTTYVFGICVVALEFGYLNIYKVGWQINTANIVANIGLAVVLLIVGFAVFHETISVKQFVGMLACAAGFVLITK